MKIEFEEKDLNYINGINADIEAGESRDMWFMKNVGSKLYLEVECVDIARANLFMHAMFAHEQSANELKCLKETFGISVPYIHFENPMDSDKEKLKRLLIDFISQIDREL